jgi:hypothetical protein
MKAIGAKGTVFEQSTARRIVRAVQTIENGGASAGPPRVTSAGDDSDAVLCRTTAAWAKGSTATLQIWAGAPGSEADTGVTLSAYNRYAAIATGKFCTVMLHRHGYYYVIAAECS